MFRPKSQDEYEDFISKTPYKISTTRFNGGLKNSNESAGYGSRI